jgi:hypothetical protein
MLVRIVSSRVLPLRGLLSFCQGMIRGHRTRFLLYPHSHEHDESEHILRNGFRAERVLHV